MNTIKNKHQIERVRILKEIRKKDLNRIRELKKKSKFKLTLEEAQELTILKKLYKKV